jgi:DNA-binding response OmpR family regulator
VSTKILAVDDDSITRVMYASMLGQGGFEVVCARGGREALDQLASQTFGLVILDLHMDDLDGLAVLRQLRRTWSLLQLPVLMVSADNNTPLMVEALEAGASDYLIKPVAPALLMTKIKRHLTLADPKPKSDALAPGSRVDGYEILALLGEGARGCVYRAREVDTLRLVALKVLESNLPVRTVSHPNLVTLYDTKDQFLVMELLHGETLDRLPLPLDCWRAARWTAEILDGLGALHGQGLIHSDLKPESVMITESGQVKLLDLGLEPLAEHEAVQGSARYMAPEQVDRSFGPVSPASDLFSVGGILYTLLTGLAPFPPLVPGQQFFTIAYADPRPPREVNPAVPDELQQICLRALQKNPFRRFRSAQEFAAALRSVRP